MGSIIAELEGTILKDPDPFAYFMLMAFEASGPIRFAVLLLFWPVIRLFYLLGKQEIGLRLAAFIAVVGVRISEIEYVGRAVLPKFYMDDLDVCKWKVFISQNGKKVVVSTTPRVMVERFVKDHLMVDHVIGSEFVVNRFGLATGLLTNVGSFSGRVAQANGVDNEPCFVLGTASHFQFKGRHYQPGMQNPLVDGHAGNAPRPVIFHDGRLVKKPNSGTSLVIVLWFPIGVVLALIRILLALIVPMGVLPFENLVLGTYYKVQGQIPRLPRHSCSGGGALLVCNHRMFGDPLVLSHLLHAKIPAVTYSISRLTEICSPIPTVRLTRNRDVDAEKMKKQLSKGHLVICPEGTTCREPYLLRFSALFAELTDQIVPVALLHHPTFFHPSTARGWKALDPLFYCMNPTIFSEVTFLNKLEAKDISGKSPYEIANYVQSLIANTLGFTCTSYTRKDKYRILAKE